MKHPKNFRVVNLLMLTVAGIVNAFGITIFLTPVKLYDSGISGTSMLLEQITPPYLSLSFFLLLLNIPLFLFGLKKLGRLFTAYAIYTVAVYSLFAGTRKVKWPRNRHLGLSSSKALSAFFFVFRGRPEACAHWKTPPGLR